MEGHESQAPDPREDVPRTQLEQLVALIAHEVNTPLAVAKFAASAVRDLDGTTDADREERSELLAMVERNVELAMLLLDRLTLARDVEAGAVSLARETLDLGDLVCETIDDLRMVALDGHPIEVTGTDGLMVFADPTASREIVFNLISNAAKYSDEGAPIEVSVEEGDDAIRLTVRNHGGGVTPGHTERIFEKYFQADTGSSGVGLGLYISRGLARAHGGEIHVRPAEDEGSEFVLDLPRQARAASVSPGSPGHHSSTTERGKSA